MSSELFCAKYLTFVDVFSLAVPPSYEQSFNGKFHIREDHDTDYTRGDMSWAPSYPFYPQLSVDAAKH